VTIERISEEDNFELEFLELGSLQGETGEEGGE
jgi:hypothetical protein